jgi:phenylpyruvate tautomerase PptA (4-oxalocrotonate tautomerase family)
MPITKIDLVEGKSQDFKSSLIDTVHAALVDSLEIPQNDRMIRITEHVADFFCLEPPYEYLIEILLFKGRTKQTKKKLFESIVKKLGQELKIDPKTIFIVLNEQPLENWGIRGGIPADEVQLGFIIEK